MIAKKLLDKYKETGKLLKKEEEFLFKRFREKNDYLAQRKSKIIDFKWNANCKCVSCNTIIYWNTANGCHRIDKGRSWNYRCRREERNIRAWCTDCNNYNKEMHKLHYTIYMVKRYWQERVNEKADEEKKLHKKPHRTELYEIRKWLHQRYKDNNHETK